MKNNLFNTVHREQYDYLNGQHIYYVGNFLKFKPDTNDKMNQK